MESLNLVKDKLGKPYDDLEFLLTCLKEVMIESGEIELAAEIPWINPIAEFQNNQFTEKQLQLWFCCLLVLKQEL